MDLSFYKDRCNNCQIWPDNPEQNHCCQEIETVAAKVAVEPTEIKCIIQHHGFQPVCTNRHSLGVAWLQYKQQYGGKAKEGPEHKKLRHTAYRQFVRWCWQFLGKDIRVPLPSCVYKAIRIAFPTPENPPNYVGFHCWMSQSRFSNDCMIRNESMLFLGAILQYMWCL